MFSALFTSARETSIKKGKGHAGQEAMVAHVAKVRTSSLTQKYEKTVRPPRVNLCRSVGRRWG
jgi:hypothetical protein